MLKLDRREFLLQLGGVAAQSCASTLFSSKAAASSAIQKSTGTEQIAVFWKSGANPGEVAMLAGHRLDEAAVSLAYFPDQTEDTSIVRSGEDSFSGLSWEPAMVVERASQYLYVQIPSTWSVGQYALRLQDRSDHPLMLKLNTPEIWWTLGEDGEAAAPGTELRIFGQFFELEKRQPRAKLIDSQRHTLSLVPEKVNPYSMIVRLPADLPEGEAMVQIHNGSGGPAGWSAPYVVTIARSRAWPTETYSVMDYGAAGDSEHDDTTAFRTALEAAAHNQGGIVFVPKGVYRITGKLTMPPRVTLRGADRENVWLMVPKEVAGFDTVIGGMGEFAVEELSIVAQTPMHIVTAPDIASQYTNYLPWGDTGSAVAPDVRLRRLRIHHLRYAHRLGTDGKDPRRAEDAGPSTIALAGPRMSIQDCVVVSPGMPIILHRISHSRVVGNEFRIGRNGWYGFWGARDSLIEGNIFEGQDLEASYGSFANYGDGSGPDIARLYIADNQYLNSFGDEREAITFDSSGFYPWKGRVSGSTANSITIGMRGAENWIGLGCLVTGGKGVGQLRKVLTVKDNSIAVDSPWTITPDESSTVAFMPFKTNVVVYRNRSQDASVGVQLWGGGYNFIVDSNVTTRSGGFWGSAAEYTDIQTTPPTQYFLPLYFTQWLRNEIHDGFIFEQGPDSTNGAVCGLYIRDIYEGENGGILTFGNVIRGNQLHNRAKIVLRYYDKQLDPQRVITLRHARKQPWSMATLIEGNIISDSPIGIEIEEGFDGVLLRNNHFTRVKQETRM